MLWRWLDSAAGYALYGSLRAAAWVFDRVIGEDPIVQAWEIMDRVINGLALTGIGFFCLAGMLWIVTAAVRWLR